MSTISETNLGQTGATISNLFINILHEGSVHRSLLANYVSNATTC